MKILAPAKVNLYLRIVGKRADGYHLLDSLMAPVSLYDELRITRSPKGSDPIEVTCDDASVPTGRKNLVYRAAEILLQRANLFTPIHIHIKKKIPLGSGLGSGSTDAAATLVGLNRLLRLEWSIPVMAKLGASIGADIPFFIHGGPAIVRGVGDRIRSVSNLPRLWLVIVYPGFPVSTQWVYNHLNFELTKPIKNTKLILPLSHSDQLVRLLVNDLEGVTIARHPRIASLKQTLIQEGAIGALMSGSGSSIFGIFAAEEGARMALRRLRTKDPIQSYLVRLLT